MSKNTDWELVLQPVKTWQVHSRFEQWKKMHGAVGMLDMPLFTGGQATHAASCMSSCMSLHGALHILYVNCPLAWHLLWHPAGSPYLLKY